MTKQSLGIIETIGLAPAVVAADVCLKAANIELVGYELTKGSGMAVIKIEGEVSSVTAAVLAAKVELDKYEAIWSVKVIARPSEDIELLTRNIETVGYNLITKENLDEELNNEDEEEKIEIENIKNDKVVDDEEKLDNKNLDKKEESKNEITCNMCHDPKCSREKGDLRKDCIHYNEIEK